MEITSLQLQHIVTQAINRTLEVSGKIKPIIYLSEAYNMASRKTVDRALKSGALKPIKKGGKTSKIWISRSEFDKWILKDEILNELIK
jgi:hypothetical protein